MKSLSVMAAATMAGLVFAGSAMAEDHQIEMYTRGPDGGSMVFVPNYLEVAPGDTVTFVSTQPTHNAQSIPGMLPEGAELFTGRMNQDVSVTLTEEGVYGIKCLPHYGMGMVALIKVGEGEPANLEEASGVRHPPLARRTLEGLLAQAAAE
ncbi:pseudoazurin [Marinicauda pacifica]|jgi:pseudoazurin|uniref:Pseudoazurin n=1 Tax=Marinicauda pacifica TaxID=1133559 RepID=A0A4S2HBA3_9PROT|nr:pseudoazurin [Marinicauda pacifica]TGY93043.1 pseudoazurin [Marinicauda pacifica]GGE42344.1 pseudoazurin [Marinicauda pacifica]